MSYDFSSIKDPLVKQYLADKYGDGNRVKDAQAEMENVQLAAAGVSAVDSLANASRQPIALQNRMQDLGRAPTVVQDPLQKTDVSGLQKQAQMKLDQARSDESDAVRTAFEQRKAELAAEAAQAKAAEDQKRWQAGHDVERQRLEETVRHNQAMENKPKTTDPLVELLRMEQLSKLRREASQTANELNVPGYVRTGEVTQSPAEAKDTRKEIGIANNMFKGLDLLQQQIDQNGSFEWGGTAGAEMAATANDLRLQAKELYNLGVLNGPDLALMLKQIPDTESLGAMFTRDATAKSQLKSTTAAMKRKIEESMRAKGYAPQTADPTSGPNPGDVVDGWTFLGGDPSQPSSWKK